MDDTDKKIEEIERDFLIRNAGDIYEEDAFDLIAQLKKCREEIEGPNGFKDRENNRNAELLGYKLHQPDLIRVIEQRTRRACFKAGWAWIQDDFGEQFGYDPTDDTDKEDFKQAIDEAKVE